MKARRPKVFEPASYKLLRSFKFGGRRSKLRNPYERLITEFATKEFVG
jgi:hypothetical protein